MNNLLFHFDVQAVAGICVSWGRCYIYAWSIVLYHSPMSAHKFLMVIETLDLLYEFLNWNLIVAK